MMITESQVSQILIETRLILEICNFSCDCKFQLNTKHTKFEEMPSHHFSVTAHSVRRSWGEHPETTVGTFLWRRVSQREQPDVICKAYI